MRHNEASIPEAVTAWLRDHSQGKITRVSAVSGGCISQGRVMTTDRGISYFLKTNHHTPPDMFAREAEGLLALAVDGSPRVPRPILHGDHYILMEDLQPAPPARDYWPEFGRQMARLHLYTAARYGFAHGNYIGSTPQPNPWTRDGYDFFGRHRLQFQADLASRKGLITSSDRQRVQVLADRLPELIPTQPASLIHGDLWSGNAITGGNGEPAIIDPAAHYGWAEAELGMTALFGGFPPDFYAGYEEIRPLTPAYRDRFPIYNLYHLLNHLNLFGTSYLSRVQQILRRFAS